jgi:hypothetical protein
VDTIFSPACTVFICSWKFILLSSFIANREFKARVGSFL